MFSHQWEATWEKLGLPSNTEAYPERGAPRGGQLAMLFAEEQRVIS